MVLESVKELGRASSMRRLWMRSFLCVCGLTGMGIFMVRITLHSPDRTKNISSASSPCLVSSELRGKLREASTNASARRPCRQRKADEGRSGKMGGRGNVEAVSTHARKA